MGAISDHRAAGLGVQMSKLASGVLCSTFCWEERSLFPLSAWLFPMRKGALAGILLDECKGSQAAAFNEMRIHSSTCVYSFVTPCRQEMYRAAWCPAFLPQPQQQLFKQHKPSLCGRSSDPSFQHLSRTYSLSRLFHFFLPLISQALQGTCNFSL